MSDQSSSDDGESDPQHSLSMVFLLVLVFFIMGLVGFLICHVLKKKGYRCRTFRDELDPDNKDVLAELQASEYGQRGAGGLQRCPLVLLKFSPRVWAGGGRGPCGGTWCPPFFPGPVPTTCSQSPCSPELCPMGTCQSSRLELAGHEDTV